MERPSHLLPLLILLWIYVFLGFCIPGALALWPRLEFNDGELVKIRTSGSFSHGFLSTIDYTLGRNGTEVVYESRFLGLSDISVVTKEQKDGTFVIGSVEMGSQFYIKTLRDHPEILAEAEKVLQLGRDKFAKAKKKLEEQKLKPDQSDRLG